MIWDARVWSFFMYVISTALFLCGFTTPYNMPGNNELVPVSYGGNVNPEHGNFYGLWGPVPDGLTGTMTAVRGLLCVDAVMIFAAFILYILLFKRSNTIIQVLACAANVLSGVMGLIATGVFRGATDEMGEGFYFVASSGGLQVLIGIVLVLMPWMEYQAPQWKIAQPEAVPLTKDPKKHEDDPEV